MSDKKKVNRTIVSKQKQMNGKIKLSFKQKTQKPVFVSYEEAEKWNVGDNYDPSPKKEESTGDE